MEPVEDLVLTVGKFGLVGRRHSDVVQAHRLATFELERFRLLRDMVRVEARRSPPTRIVTVTPAVQRE